MDLSLVMENECLDDLQLEHLFLIQKKDGFKFGIDAVLLSSIVRSKESDIVFDFCTGSGVIPILLSHKIPSKRLIGIELDEEMTDMARRSVSLNALEDRIEISCMDIREIPVNGVFPSDYADVICANPPYFRRNSSILNEDVKKIAARHEVYLSLEELFVSVRYLLKDRGIFYMIHRPDRLVDIFELGRKYSLEPKWMQMVYPKKEKAANLVLLKFIKSANRELRLEKPLFVYDENGEYTREINEIYNRH